jgi:hypothetical protein
MVMEKIDQFQILDGFFNNRFASKRQTISGTMTGFGGNGAGLKF